MEPGGQAGAGAGEAPQALGLDPLGGQGAGNSRPGTPEAHYVTPAIQVGEGGEVWSKAVDSSFNVQVF